MPDVSPSETPNVVVANPHVRKVANVVLGTALVVFPAAAVLDASSAALDFSTWLVPATAVTSFLAGVFGLAVTTPNVPKEPASPDMTAEIADELLTKYAAQLGLTRSQVSADFEAARARALGDQT